MRLHIVILMATMILAPTQSFSQQSAVNSNYGKLPLSFEANRGQAASHVDFLSRNKGYNALLSAGNLTLSLPVEVTPTDLTQGGHPRTVQMKLLGAAKNPLPLGEGPLPGKVNYFLGNNPANWRTNVPTYSAVRYKNIYPGVDLLYYGNKGHMEFDFELQPGTGPSKIQFEIQGADTIALNSAGTLILKLGTRSLQIQSPSVYQNSNGRRVAIGGSYILTDASHVAFDLAQYDPSKPLVIDPVLLYSTYLGGSGNDEVTGIAVDSAGSVYVAGFTDSTNFPLATQGSLPTGSDHVFVSKLDPTGSTIEYTDYIGGNSEDCGFALAVNSSNEVYVTGSTASSDFPVVNAYQATYPGSFNGFLTRISADGSSLLYSTYFGGNGPDMPAGIALDRAANILIAGNTSSTNFPVVNAYQSTASPNQGGYYGNYGFLTKFTADGSALAFSTYFAGNSNVPYNCGGTPCWPQPFNAITGIALDSAGNAYVAGNTNTYNFPTTAGAYLTTNSTQFNAPVAFTSKFGTSGALLYSTYFYDSSNFTNINAIAVDAAGSAYVSGAGLSDSTFPLTTTSICDPSVYNIACSYAFVSKFDPVGSSLVYSTFLGPNNYANPSSLLLDQNNNAYVLATTSSNSFALVDGIEGPAGGNDVVLAEIDATAGSELTATYIGGSSDERAAAMALDATGNLYITGTSNSTDFPVTQGAFQEQSGGNTDAFILKIGTASLPAVTLNPYALQFSSVQIGSSSAVQQVLLRNMGSSSLTINTISVPANFAETDNCGTSLPAASSCSLSITFSPITTGSINASISIQDNASGSPHIVAVSGTGYGPIVSFSSSALTFPGTPVGMTSASQTITLTNSGNANLTISTLQISGDYLQTNACPAVLAPQSNCAINVTFAPTASGMRTGTLTINDDAGSSPQSIPLAGSGIQPAPMVSLSSSALTFAGTPVGGTSPSQTVIVTNQGNANLTISSIQISGDYGQTNNCPGTLNPQATCAVTIIFSPTGAGNRTGVFTMNDNAAGNPQNVALAGSGMDFTLTTSQPSDTVKAGVSATYPLSVSSAGGAFTNAINLVCVGAPLLTRCNVSSNSVTPGSNTVSVTVTVATTGSSAQQMPAASQANRLAFAFWTPFSGVGVFGLMLRGRKRVRKSGMLLGLLLAIVALVFMSACAGGTGIGSQGKTGTTAGTYTITINGSSGNLKHSLPLTLTVQ